MCGYQLSSPASGKLCVEPLPIPQQGNYLITFSLNPAAGSNSADLVSVTSYLRALYPGLVPGNSTYTANPNLGKSTFSGTLLLTAVPAGKYYLDLNVTTAAYPYHWKGMFSFQVMALPLTVGNGVSNMTTIQSATPQAAPMLATAAVAEYIRVDSYMVLQDGRAELDLTQADGSAPSEVSKPKHGALTGKGQGRYVYTPKSGYCGADEFSTSFATVSRHAAARSACKWLRQRPKKPKRCSQCRQASL